jgi:hypothetical protein
MIEYGYAWFYRETAGNDKRTRNRLADAEDKARKESKGLWGAGNPMAPWEYRRIEEQRRTTEASELQRKAEELARIESTAKAEERRLALEKYKAKQIAKGLVEYNGDWMTPEQRDKELEKDELRRKADQQAAIARAQEAERQKRIQEKYESEQRAKGLVKHDGKWITPQEVKRLETEKASTAAKPVAARPKDWQELQFDHFRVYHKGCPELADKTGKYLESRFKAMTKQLDIVTGLDLLWYGPNSIKVYIYPTREELIEDRHLPRWAAGAADYPNRAIYSMENEDDIKRIVSHELGHHLFRDIINNRPIIGWVSEGMARWLEPEEYRSARKESLAAAKQNNKLISLNDLTSIRHYQALDGEKAGLFYAQSERLVDVLMRAYDLSVFRNFCVHLQGGSDFTTSFNLYYSPKFQSLEGLNKAWLDSM